MLVEDIPVIGTELDFQARLLEAFENRSQLLRALAEIHGTGEILAVRLDMDQGKVLGCKI